MNTLRLPDKTINFTAETPSTQPRVYAKRIDWPLPRSSKRILMCSFCHHISTVIGWTDLERATQVIQVFDEPVLPAIDYTICESDQARFEKLRLERLE